MCVADAASGEQPRAEAARATVADEHRLILRLVTSPDMVITDCRAPPRSERNMTLCCDVVWPAPALMPSFAGQA